MPRRPVGPVWTVNHVRLTVVPDTRAAQPAWLCKVSRRDTGARTQSQYATEREAIVAAETLARTLAAPGGGVPSVDTLTISELIERYERKRRVANPKRRASTALAQEVTFRRIRAAFAELTPSALTEDDVLQWLEGLQRTYAPLTAARTLEVFRAVLTGAGQGQVLEDVPRIQAERSRPDEPWTPKELRLILTAAREGWATRRPQYVLGLWLWIQSGMRAGEIAALRPDDINTTTGLVDLTQTFSRGRLGPLKVKRTAPPSVLLPMLIDTEEWKPGVVAETWRVFQFFDQCRSRALLPSGFLCGGTPGTPWRHQVMHRWFREVIDRAGVPYREPEIFRHTMAATLLGRGAKTSFVKNQGGWASIDIVEKVYARFMRPDVPAPARPLELPDEGQVERAGEVGLLPQQLTTVRRKRAKSLRSVS